MPKQSANMNGGITEKRYPNFDVSERGIGR
jgi:hypothetical protein